MNFEAFPKIARLSRECVVTEKIDGTNAQVCIAKVPDVSTFESRAWVDRWALLVLGDMMLLAGSRTRWITPEDDNFGFAAWAKEHALELWTLGEGRHYGEWWGSGIQRGYGLVKGEKRFSLFNVARWADDRDREKFPNNRPPCCGVVPVLYRGEFYTNEIEQCLSFLRSDGSVAAPGFMKPEGVIVFHTAASLMFKKTLEKDEEGKEQQARRLAHERKQVQGASC